MTENFANTKTVLQVPLLFVFAIWGVYYLEIKFGFNFNSYGIYPRTLSGLKGILFSPFIHSNAKHLLNNTLPLFVLLIALFYFYKAIAYKVLFIGTFFAEFITWLIGRDSFHIGASGVIYLLVSFVFFSGIFRKYYRLTALSLAVVFWYGGMVWYIFPIEDNISWEGHLGGFIMGLILAYIYRYLGPKPKEFTFSEDKEFEALFDEDGNFNPPIQEDTLQENITEEDQTEIKG